MKIPKLKYFVQLLVSSLFIVACSSDNISPEEPIQDDCLRIGDFHQGGIIFYIDHTNQHGLIAAGIDQSDAALWGCQDTTIETAVARDIGYGQENTLAIVNNCSDNNIAAKICAELSLNGFNDWFLPSVHELELLYHYKNLVGGFAEGHYYSSSERKYEDKYENAATIDFTSNLSNPHRLKFINKSVPARVRAIRKF
ncbi:MAG TPA: hypothetical protein VKX40_08360 [Aequorivita sp.]|nr:hypothetical protein [Aequorivita sp.]